MLDHDVTLPTISADLLLIHPPAFFDFRERRDIYFPFLGTSGDVPITPLYEYFPLGFKTIKRFLGERGHDVKIINLSTVMLKYPKINIDTLIEAFDAKVIGIDLHWMVHVQGSLAVAKRIKEILPDVLTLFGGISSTYYADQLIEYPFIDMVMRGYETHQPLVDLFTALKGDKNLEGIPNLLWKRRDGQIHDNSFTYKPGSFGCGIDWSNQPSTGTNEVIPILEFLSTQNAGCSYNCGWCGGSREAFRRIFKRSRAMARKSPDEIRYEFETMNNLPNVDKYHFYSVGSYNESKASMNYFLDLVENANFKSISYEQYYLTPEDVMKRMAKANKRTFITLSPESHDMRVAKLSGRGVYTNDELENWLYKAIDIGIYQVDIWYFIGMPEQDERSVIETVEYCDKLLEKFKGIRVQPMICPMIPFLDPASTFFEYPDEHGYRIFYRTVEEHRRGMENASLINRINYETRWLSRSDLVHVGFKAVQRLIEARAVHGQLPTHWAKRYNAMIDDALEFIEVVHEADCISDKREREQELDKLGDEILRRNDLIFYSGVMNQAVPIYRKIGMRWFDEMGWEPETLEALESGSVRVQL
jgi:clorobiocin/coumermycin A biosynthesis protein CloN6/CouN6